MYSEYRERSPIPEDETNRQGKLNCFLCLKPAVTSSWFDKLTSDKKHELVEHLLQQLVRKSPTQVRIPDGFLDHLEKDFPFCGYCSKCCQQLWEYEELRRNSEAKINEALSDMEAAVAGVDLNSMKKVYKEMLQARGHALPFMRLRAIIYLRYQDKLRNDHQSRTPSILRVEEQAEELTPRSSDEIEEVYEIVYIKSESELSEPVQESPELEILLDTRELGELRCENVQVDELYDYEEDECATLEREVSVSPTEKGGNVLGPLAANGNDNLPTMKLQRTKGRKFPKSGVGMKKLLFKKSAPSAKPKRRKRRAKKLGSSRTNPASPRKKSGSSRKKQRSRGASTIIFPVRLPQNPKFMVALSPQDVAEVEDSVRQLGGSISTLNGFDKSCCGVIASCLGPGEKIAGCLAFGKPLLKMDYIQDCWRSDRFIPVEEWYTWYPDKEQVKAATETVIALGIYGEKR